MGTQTITLGISDLGNNNFTVTYGPNGGTITLTPSEDVVHWTLATSDASIVTITIPPGTGTAGSNIPWPNAQPAASIAASLWTVSDGNGDPGTVTYNYSAAVATSIGGVATTIFGDPEIVNNPPGHGGVDPGVITTPPGSRK